jgi:type III secretory pathway component EscV
MTASTERINGILNRLRAAPLSQRSAILNELADEELTNETLIGVLRASLNWPETKKDGATLVNYSRVIRDAQNGKFGPQGDSATALIRALATFSERDAKRQG